MATDASRRASNRHLGPHEHGEPLTADTDLAGRWVGGSVVAASDESFGDKENLLKPGPAAYEPGRYGNRGEIVDGWETRRRREPGYDWALIRLGTPGTISSIDVDTSFFTGNFPESCRIEACGAEGYPSPADLNGPNTEWIEIVPHTPLRGDAHNTFPASDSRRFTHVRLSTFPDGGVARLRVLGRVVPDPRPFDGLTIDLASQQHGGAVVASSDGFYTSAHVLNRPDRARTMGEGWETRRRRDTGHDYVVIELALAGDVHQVIVDTAHFVYNASAEIELYGCETQPAPSVESPAWQPLLPRIRLQPDTRHVFAVQPDGPIGSIRLDAFPDGGLSRVRVTGSVDPGARRRAGYRWFNALPRTQAIRGSTDAGIPPDVAAGIADERPLAEAWLDGIRKRANAKRQPDEAEAYVRELAALLEGPSR